MPTLEFGKLPESIVERVYRVAQWMASHPIRPIQFHGLQTSGRLNVGVVLWVVIGLLVSISLALVLALSIVNPLRGPSPSPLPGDFGVPQSDVVEPSPLIVAMMKALQSEAGQYMVLSTFAVGILILVVITLSVLKVALWPNGSEARVVAQRLLPFVISIWLTVIGGPVVAFSLI